MTSVIRSEGGESEKICSWGEMDGIAALCHRFQALSSDPHWSGLLRDVVTQADVLTWTSALPRGIRFQRSPANEPV